VNDLGISLSKQPQNNPRPTLRLLTLRLRFENVRPFGHPVEISVQEQKLSLDIESRNIGLRLFWTVFNNSRPAGMSHPTYNEFLMPNFHWQLDNSSLVNLTSPYFLVNSSIISICVFCKELSQIIG
jgi:hypothetical protein